MLRLVLMRVRLVLCFFLCHLLPPSRYPFLHFLVSASLFDSLFFFSEHRPHITHAPAHRAHAIHRPNLMLLDAFTWLEVAQQYCVCHPWCCVGICPSLHRCMNRVKVCSGRNVQKLLPCIRCADLDAPFFSLFCGCRACMCGACMCGACRVVSCRAVSLCVRVCAG
jgi:hypothetical protein